VDVPGIIEDIANFIEFLISSWMLYHHRLYDEPHDCFLGMISQYEQASYFQLP
jgi:hypothetical protein